MRSKNLLIVAILALGFLLGACAKKTDTPSTTSTPTPTASTSPAESIPAADAVAVSEGNVNPCLLLTTAEVESAIGKEVEDGKYNDLSGNGSCSWKLTSASADTTVEVTHWKDRKQIEAGIEERKDEMEEVGGVGEAAYWHESLRVLTWLQDEKAWDVQFAGGQEGLTKETAIKFAKAFVPKAADA